MFSAAFQHRTTIESVLIAGSLVSFYTANAANSSISSGCDPLLEQLFPPCAQPLPQLQLKYRLELFHHFSVAFKTDPQCSAAASSLLLGCHSAPLADLLRSLRTPRLGLAFLRLAFPEISPDSVHCFCDAAFILFLSEEMKPLAQDLLAGLLHRLGSNRSAELLCWAGLQRVPTSRYHALHLVLRSFLGAGMVPEALEALAEIRRQGKTPSLSVHAILLRLLFRMGDSRNAWKLFRDMILRGPCPSVGTFNAMILGSCLKGRVAAGEGLIWLMPKFKLEPDSCSFNIVMKTHSLLGRASKVFRLFNEMLDSGHLPSIVTYNILINILCRQGRMKEARSWFNHLVEQGHEVNTITYNVLLDGYTKAGQIDAANSTYEEMVMKGLRPDLYTFNILISGHCKFRRDWEGLAQKLFRDAVREDVCTHMLISSFCWTGQVESARLLIPRDGQDGILPIVPVFNSVIVGYSKEGLVEEAMDMYKLMVEEFGLKPSSSTWKYLLLGLCRRGRLSEAKELLYEIGERGFNVGVSAFTIFIDGCFRFGKLSDGIDCLKYLERKGISLDVVGFSAYINGLCRVELVEKAHEIFNDMRGRGLIPNNFIYNSLIYGLFKIGNVKEALGLEADMRCNGLLPDILTSNIVINGYGLQRCLEMADNEFGRIGWIGLYPNSVTYNTLIADSYRASDTQRAERYFELMAFSNCKPDLFTYNIRIHSLCSSYRTPEAVKIVDMLITEGFTPNTVTHNTVMNGICVDSLGRALILTGRLIKMAIVPNVVTVNLLLSHFCKHGLAERALMWGEKFKNVSFNFDNVTLHILDKANKIVQNKAEQKAGSGKDLFLEFLMHIIYDLICISNRNTKQNQLSITSLFDNSFTSVSKMFDVR